MASTQASDLAALSSRARDAESLAEYREILTGTQLPGFERLARTWGITEGDAWGYLRRVHVEHHPVEQLRRLVLLTYELLLQGDPETVVNELRSWLDDLLHQPLTAPMLWARLRDKGYVRRLLAGDPTSVDALAATVERHCRRVETTRPALGLVRQPYVARLVERLRAADGRQVLLVDGAAGTGKSTVATEMLRALSAAGWYCAAIRMDAVGANVQTATALGRAFDLAGSPAVLLGGVSDGSPAVLLVDQLDAVSTYGGRMPDSYEAVAELLDQCASLPNIKVVLVVRTVDLSADPRIRSLVHQPRVDRLTINELDLEDVRASLSEAGVDRGRLSDSTLQLLRTPLHLAVFSRLSPESRTSAYRTLSDLYEQLTAQTRSEIERQVGGLSWNEITGALVRYMSDQERLGAPIAVLNSASPREVAALHSFGILVSDAGRVGFFHETFFDFLFATAFTAESRDLHDYLVESGQYLFRRAPARQVLEYLAANDRAAFRATVVRLLTSDRIRRHLKDVVVAVLRQLDADADDWRTIEPLVFSGRTRGMRLVSLLSSPRWFDAADAAGRWEALLAEPTTVETAAHQLIMAGRERPERVAALVRPYVGRGEAWRLRLRALVEWSLRPGLVDLAVELVERGDLDDARGPIAVNSDFWSIVYGLKTDEPAAAARLIGAYLRRALARAGADGSADPFASGHLNAYSSSGGASTIGEVAAAAPTEFVDQVLPFILAVVEAAEQTSPEEPRLRSRWAFRGIGVDHDIDEAIFTGVDEALRKLAVLQPQETVALIRPLADSDADELRFLACRTFTAAGCGDEAVDWLLSDERNFRLGWADSPRWASRELIEVASRRCDDGRLHTLTRRLLEHYPAWERSAEGRRLFGRAQYELLPAIEPSRRSAELTRRIGELERKFADWPLRGPQVVEVNFVGSPVPDRAVEFLTDIDWIRAIRRYRSDATDWSGDRLVGGANELANLLGTRAKAEPERFAQLALAFDADTPAVYFNRVIEAVAGGVPPELFAELCGRARATAGQRVGRSICHALDTVGTAANDTLLRLLEDCARDDDPDRELARTPAGSGQYYYGGDLSMAGLNSTRGAAARAIARILFAGPEHADRLTPTITRLATDPVLAVRTMAADAVGALMNHHRESALRIANSLFAEAPLDLFESRTVCQLLTFALLRDPDTFTPHLLRTLSGHEAVAKRAGFTWAIAFVRDLLVEPAPTDLEALSPPARLGAAKAFASDPSIAPQQLIRLFNDEDSAVREAAAHALRSVNDLPPSMAEALITAFVASAAYEKHAEELFIALDNSTQLLPTAALPACERAVETAGRELGDIRTARAAMSNHIINVVLRLYRQGNKCTRERCLDVIDGLVDAGAYGLEQALATER
ncbi:ATP-binding protein [Micromonospora echinaurantiaca]|uniref:ATP-binding protein n=1 Tax=Micromonospora echinaurantiaca TaxID=47857 RepID=UPI003439CB10